MSFKRNKGITLIALVVTVIVLLILAGIAINLTVGDNGIITRAERATIIQRLAEIKEQIEFANSDARIGMVAGESTHFSPNYSKIDLPENVSINNNGMLFYIGNDNSPNAEYWKQEIENINEELVKTNFNNEEQLLKEQELLDDIKLLNDLAVEFINENTSTQESVIELCLQYIRRNKYNSTIWSMGAGQVNTSFVDYVSQSESGKKINSNGYFDQATIYDIKNNAYIDFVHLCAALNAELYYARTKPFLNIKDFCGWAGDSSTLIKQIVDYDTTSDYTSEEHKNDLISYAKSLFATDNATSTFGIADVLADIDAVNIYNENYAGSNDVDFYTVIKNYYYTYNDSIANRENKFVENLCETKDALYNYVVTYLNSNTFYVTLAGGISDSKYSSNTEYYNSIMAQAFSDWFMQF